MNESEPSHVPETGRSSRPLLGEELLPPVEQPSARFIIQLFVVPALIVLAIVGVWLMFSWLVRSTSISPAKLIDGIEGGSAVARWQRASELAEMLQNKRYASIKADGKSAQRIAGILEREIKQSGEGNDSQESATLRYFLARALGEFEVQEGADILLLAATTNRSPQDKLVRHGAIEALAVRAYKLPKLEPPQVFSHPQLESTLVALSKEEDETLRSAATFALGQVGTPAAIERLEVLAIDPDLDTRANAAIALAHRGNAKAIETLVEMLDLSELTAEADKVKDQKNQSEYDYHRILLVASALDAVHSLARQNEGTDLAALAEAVDRLAHATPEQLQAARIPTRIISDARNLLPQLKPAK
ncbi:MAG: HEAT repeat domain-containing protein [Pirellulales bacterium]|nr:HEAT repeat domain-containing protein [Pirellulales bacterium]